MNTQTQRETIVELPAGFTTRAANMDDLEAAIALFNRWSRALIGEDEITDVEVLRNDLQSPGFNMNEDICLVFAPNGDLAGYIEAWTAIKPPVHPWIWGRVDPLYEGKGIGTWLMQWAEEHVRRVLPEVPDGARFAPQVSTYRQSERAKRLFEKSGYRYFRSSYQMRIEFDEPISKVEFPAGITVRTYNPDIDAEATYRAQRDAWRDHFGYVEQPFEEGLKRFKHFWSQEAFDPNFMFLAMDGDEIAGMSLCTPFSFEDPEMGWVGTLGVRREWRKRGIGLALLRHSFHKFYQRGLRKAGLGVDAENLTGALRLYEGAGMHVHQTFDRYEKELRPGIESSVQSLL
jgi:mycothiol synthase